MKSVNRIYISLAALGCILAASAQDITTEIQVQRTIEPIERGATRPSTFSPAVTLPSVQLTPLAFHEYLRPSDLTVITPVLEPVRYGDTIAVSPYRGYAAIGYFPVYNLGASAGYRFINNHNTRLGAHLQFDGLSYKGFKATDGLTFSSNNINAGVDFNRLFYNKGYLAVSADYQHGRLGTPTYGNEYRLTANIVDASATWHGFLNKGASYHVGFFYNYFSGGESSEWKNTRISHSSNAENRFSGHMGLTFGSIRKNMYGGIELTADFIKDANGDLPMTGSPTPTARSASQLQRRYDYTLGIITLSPYYGFKTDKFTGRIGLRADISTGGTGKKFHIAPDVTLGWNPLSMFAIEARISGGEQFHSLRDYYDYNQWMMPIAQTYRNNVPVDARLTIAFGPFAGAKVKLFGGYSLANDLAVNMYKSNYITLYDGWLNTLGQVDLKGWLAGVTVGYDWHRIIDFEATAMMAPQRIDRGYYMWQDHAQYVIDAKLKINPIEKLTIDLGYQFRGRRMSYCIDANLPAINLGNISDLDLGVAYRLTAPWSIWARCENLLNRRYNNLISIPAQGIKGLIGVSYKF